jgi:hypothetical protein
MRIRPVVLAAVRSSRPTRHRRARADAFAQHLPASLVYPTGHELFDRFGVEHSPHRGCRP